MYMMVRNRVRDFASWKRVFESHSELHRRAGLRLEGLWRAHDDPNNIFFLLAVEDIDRARAFIADPESERAGIEATVVDGEFHFVESAPGFPPSTSE